MALERLMPSRPSHEHRNLSSIELTLAAALTAILVALAVPSLGTWTADTQARSAAESLTDAIRLAQGTAVANGRTSLFALTTATPPVAGSTPVANSPNWFVVLDALDSPGKTRTSSGVLLGSTDGTRHDVTVAGPALTCFNALGRQITLAAGANSLSTACSAADPIVYLVASNSDASRYFEVLVYAGGWVRMCDGAKVFSIATPDGC